VLFGKSLLDEHRPHFLPVPEEHRLFPIFDHGNIIINGYTLHHPFGIKNDIVMIVANPIRFYYLSDQPRLLAQGLEENQVIFQSEVYLSNLKRVV
jgi:hypothetical protein